MRLPLWERHAECKLSIRVLAEGPVMSAALHASAYRDNWHQQGILLWSPP